MADDKKTRGPQAPKAIVDTSIIDEKRVAEIRLKAKNKVEAERKAAAEAKLLEQFTLEERQAGGLEEELVNVTLDFAPYVDRAMIDGVIYFQGQTKTVRESVALLLQEMMSATWKHQSIIDGKPEDFYRKGRGQQVVPLGNGGVGVSNILRA
jgi:hypothetical protein